MSTVRRWYIFLVSIISLQAVTWAVITLLQNLLIRTLDSSPSAVAFQIAVILVGLPIYLVHWLWGQRLAGRSDQERGAVLRSLYLYVTLAAFLGMALTSCFELVARLLRIKAQVYLWSHRLQAGEWVAFHLLTLLVLGVLWFYHWRVAAGEAGTVARSDGVATVRRLYLLASSAAGLILTTITIINLLLWVMLQIGRPPQVGLAVNLKLEIARLIVGAPLWLISWRLVQRLFDSEGEAERESALRKFYLYGAVFIGALGTVGSATATLADIFRRVLITSSVSRGDGDIRVPLSVIIGMGLQWAYHSHVLQDDAQRVSETPRQAGIRRLYLYLIAAIGLSALLVGLAGNVSVLIRSMDTSFGNALREQLAWFTAAIIAGLPVWLLPWRRLQHRATESGPAGGGARRSIVRKIYLYFFLFVATMTVLGSAVFIIHRILSYLLGGDAFILSELGHAIAYSLIAVGVWLYHGSTLRGDQTLLRPEESNAFKSLRLAVVDVEEGVFGQTLVEALQRATPELDPDLVLLAQPETGDQSIATRLSKVDAIIGPWTIQGIQAVANSPARKVLLPTHTEGWEWAGVARLSTDALVRQAVQAVKQIAAGGEVRTARPLGAGAIVGIVVGVIVILPVLFSLIIGLLDYLF